MSLINKITVGSTNYNIASSAYYTCTTAAGTANKSIEGLSTSEIVDGLEIRVKFTNTNTATYPKLYVGSTGYSIYCYGTKNLQSSWQANEVVSFTFVASGNTFVAVTTNARGAALVLDSEGNISGPIYTNGVRGLYDPDGDDYTGRISFGTGNSTGIVTLTGEGESHDALISLQGTYYDDEGTISLTGTTTINSANRVTVTDGTTSNSVAYLSDITDTKNTAGTTNKTGTKMYLAAATSQGANPQTYSNSNCYIGTDNCLYSGGSKVLTTSAAASTVDGVTASSGTINRYAICSTSSSTATKEASITSGDVPALTSSAKGFKVTIQFNNENTAMGNAKLNLNSKGAKDICYRGEYVSGTNENRQVLKGVVDLIFDGTKWNVVGPAVRTPIVDSFTWYNNSSGYKDLDLIGVRNCIFTYHSYSGDEDDNYTRIYTCIAHTEDHYNDQSGIDTFTGYLKYFNGSNWVDVPNGSTVYYSKIRK